MKLSIYFFERCIIYQCVSQMISETQCVLQSKKKQNNCFLFLMNLLWSKGKSMFQLLSRCVTHVAPYRINTTTKDAPSKNVDIPADHIRQRRAALINLDTMNNQSAVACLATQIKGQTPMASCTIGSHVRRWFPSAPDDASPWYGAVRATLRATPAQAQ